MHSCIGFCSGLVILLTVFYYSQDLSLGFENRISHVNYVPAANTLGVLIQALHILRDGESETRKEHQITFYFL